jgi:hypothetical protein
MVGKEMFMLIVDHPCHPGPSSESGPYTATRPRIKMMLGHSLFMKVLSMIHYQTTASALFGSYTFCKNYR